MVKGGRKGEIKNKRNKRNGGFSSINCSASGKVPLVHGGNISQLLCAFLNFSHDYIPTFYLF
jgi:hypothetical protein